MDLDERRHLRDLVLGDDQQREELHALLTSESADQSVRRLVDDITPPLERLRRIVDEHLPLGTPEEAVAYALTHASGFSVAAVVEYCGAAEQRGGDPVDEVRRLLADHVRAGQLSVEYVFDCPGCGNMITGRDELPAETLEVYCDHDRCRVAHRIDPAAAHAVFINANQDPELESWI
jgi:hypothetical protein